MPKQEDQFEKWLKSERGSKSLSALTDHIRESSATYARNCLWWAFQGGLEADDIQYTDTGNMLRKLLEQKAAYRLPKYIIRQIESIIQNNKL